MNQQTGKTAALYYRVASTQTETLYLDNQMHILLCYANEQGLDGFTLYADVGKSGLTLDRPGFNALKADIEAGHIGKVIVYNASRIGRDIFLVGEFMEWAQARDVEVVSITDTELHMTLKLLGATLSTIDKSLLNGGGCE